MQEYIFVCYFTQYFIHMSHICSSYHITEQGIDLINANMRCLFCLLLRCKCEKKNVFANRYRIFEGMGLQFSSVLRPQHNSEYQFATVLVQALIFICTMIKRKPLFLNFTGN